MKTKISEIVIKGTSEIATLVSEIESTKQVK